MKLPGWQPETAARMRRQLLRWYDRSRRDLPWRRTHDPYAICDPYAIWVSEIMLQQTRVAVVVERFKAFMERFPTVLALALAPEQDVLALWSGLGYYRRARMLHKAAQFVAEHHAGSLPATAEKLKLLPGIGSYTAAAIASIAHGEPVAVVDGNVERVLCRVRGWQAGRVSATALRRQVETAAAELLDAARPDAKRPGDFNQAMMELGATVCTPRNPQCLLCPLAQDCVTRGEHKTVKRPRMVSEDVACALGLREGPAGEEVLLEQRAESNTVMPGLWQLPMLRVTAVPEKALRMTVRHAIMQVNYTVRVRTVTEKAAKKLTVSGGQRRWVALSEAGGMALTGLARKVLGRAGAIPSPAARDDRLQAAQGQTARQNHGHPELREVRDHGI
ncbi:MAG TPA: A/G-specific adenine glycosylase [Terracidiphilus sp.]|jgi:A/G-specific adenine glycosylase|nr:A/G-specific adenine glycosylase [Terracidiphilus sp.]